MKPRVLIVIDNAKRELFGCTLVSHYLDRLDVDSRLCGLYAFRENFLRYQPDAVVWPNPLFDLSEVAETSAVLVLPSESGNGQPDLIAAHAGTAQNPVYPGAVDRFLCWGPAMREVLRESGRWRDDQLAVTGSPATDHWLLPRRARPDAARRLGITTTFRALSNAAAPRRMNYFEWIDGAERAGSDGTFYLPPEHVESWIFYEASLARVLVDLIRALAVERSETVHIRPHPLELTVRYRYFEAIGGGRVVVSKRGTMSEWLERIGLVFTFMSASALDAVVRGVPVVSLMGLLDADALRKIPRHFRYGYEDMLWQLADVKDAADYVERAARGQLEPCRDRRAIDRLLAEHFAYPRQQPAARHVAAEIKRVLDEDRPRRAPAARGRRGWRAAREALARHVPLASYGLTVGRYVHSLLPGQSKLDFSYAPWRLADRRAAARASACVLQVADEGPA